MLPVARLAQPALHDRGHAAALRTKESVLGGQGSFTDLFSQPDDLAADVAFQLAQHLDPIGRGFGVAQTFARDS
jgi:hypothetical protein